MLLRRPHARADPDSIVLSRAGPRRLRVSNCQSGSSYALATPTNFVIAHTYSRMIRRLIAALALAQASAKVFFEEVRASAVSMPTARAMRCMHQ